MEEPKVATVRQIEKSFDEVSTPFEPIFPPVSLRYQEIHDVMLYFLTSLGRDFIDIVEAVIIQNVLKVADVRPAPMQGCFSEQARSIARIADCSHPSRGSFRQLEWAIIPDAGVMRITPSRE